MANIAVTQLATDVLEVLLVVDKIASYIELLSRPTLHFTPNILLEIVIRHIANNMVFLGD